jgi:AraC-like DNA-binding protein
VTSTIIVLALLFAFLAMLLVIVLLIRTTRNVVDKNTELTRQLLETPVDQIRQDISSVDQPMKMTDAQLMAWLDSKMEETALYRQADIDLKTVAETLGISQRRIIRLLKSQPQYGSFATYLTEKRLEKACALLKQHPEYTIESLCKDAGFSSRRTFQTVFKTRLGMSPSEYRSAAINEDKQL